MRHAQVFAALLIGLLATAMPARCQVFKVQGGTSTLYNAEGGSVEFKAPNYTGSLGLGFYNGDFHWGAVTRTQYHDYTVTGGDDSILFDLPTDWFDGAHYFLARGVGVSRIDKVSNFRAFAGTTSTGFFTGFFQAAQSDDPAALYFYDRRLTPQLRWSSRNVVSKYQSSLQALSWHPRKWLEVSGSGGIGSNQPYAAAGFNIETQKLAFKAGYFDTGDRFRRITLTTPLASEVQKGNAEIAYQPNRILSFDAGHHEILEPLSFNAPFTPASVNEVGANVHLGRNYFGAGYFQSDVESRSTTGENVYAGRRVTNNIDVTANYFVSRQQHGPKNDIASGTIRETLSKRISLLELVTRSDGQTTFAFGGDFLTNRFKFRADYQNVYLPYRPTQPFEQALAVNAAVRIYGPWQITGASNVAPNGKLRYTFGVSTYLYRQKGMWRAEDPDSFSFPKYVIAGVVHDADGNPVEGATIHIGNQIVYTDETGEFLLRVRKKTDQPVQVAVDEFVAAGTFEVVSAPPSAKPAIEDEAQKVEIVVKRIAVKKP
ncbi:MAG TPA: hypothetical protein VFO39_06725 [Candidatus Sulfotelmatobacter sp.]|nr:hypothetical protein [Candidatus Sulfotelmatobacter sp.]